MDLDNHHLSIAPARRFPYVRKKTASRAPAAPQPAPLVSPGEDAAAWAARALHFTPDPRQVEVLQTASSRAILCCSRQWGKSTVAAVRALWTALRQPGAEVLVVSPTARQSAEFVRKAAAFLPALGLRSRGDGMNPHSLRFPNRSRIVALPGVERNIRGFSRIALVIVDEAARVPDDLYKAVRPMLAIGGGQLWLISTPYGQNGFFWDTWDKHAPAWARFSVKAEDCPRISPAFLAEERAALGERWFRQEYCCDFVAGARGLFDRAVLDALWSADVPPLFKGFVASRRPSTSRWYIGLDLGKKQDPSALVVIERRQSTSPLRDPISQEFPTLTSTTVRHALRFELGLDYQEVVNQVASLIRHPDLKGEKTLIVDASGVGLPVVELLTRGRLGCNVIPITITGAGSARSNGTGYNVPRRDLMDGLRLMAANGDFHISRNLPDGDALIDELLALEDDGRSRRHDDLAIALALACWRLRQWFDPNGQLPLGIEPGRAPWR